MVPKLSRIRFTGHTSAHWQRSSPCRYASRRRQEIFYTQGITTPTSVYVCGPHIRRSPAASPVFGSFDWRMVSAAGRRRSQDGEMLPWVALRQESAFRPAHLGFGQREVASDVGPLGLEPCMRRRNSLCRTRARKEQKTWPRKSRRTAAIEEGLARPGSTIHVRVASEYQRPSYALRIGSVVVDLEHAALCAQALKPRFPTRPLGPPLSSLVCSFFRIASRVAASLRAWAGSGRPRSDGKALRRLRRRLPRPLPCHPSVDFLHFEFQRRVPRPRHRHRLEGRGIGQHFLSLLLRCRAPKCTTRALHSG